MSKGSVIGSILGAVVITLALVYFVVPMVYTPAGTVLQTQRHEETSVGSVQDEVGSLWVSVTGVNLTITTRGGSKLVGSFSAMYVFQLSTSLGASDVIQLNVSLIVVGVCNKSTILGMVLGYVPSATARIPYPVLIEIETDTLPAGTYKAEVKICWVTNPGGVNFIYTGYPDGVHSQPQILEMSEVKV